MKLSYHNYKSDCCSHLLWPEWFAIERYWRGKLIHVRVKHHCLVIDLRGDWVWDMKGAK